ncbi:MAG: hypothetical protein M1816_004371 [Peltula sp. TS41687]|nr:MAG: hypothetical protein M1816_004371 [Peltula sp. TS41687]
MRLDQLFFLDLIILFLAPLTISASIHDGWSSLSRRANEPPHESTNEQALSEEEKRAVLTRRYMDLDYEQTFRYEACAKMLEESGPLLVPEIESCMEYAELSTKQRFQFDDCVAMMEHRLPNFWTIPLSIMAACLEYAKNRRFTIEDVYKEVPEKQNESTGQDGQNNLAVHVGKLINAASKGVKQAMPGLPSTHTFSGPLNVLSGLKGIPAVP